MSERLHVSSMRLQGVTYVVASDVRLVVEALRRLNPGHEGSLRQVAELLDQVEEQQRAG